MCPVDETIVFSHPAQKEDDTSAQMTTVTRRQKISGLEVAVPGSAAVWPGLLAGTLDFRPQIPWRSWEGPCPIWSRSQTLQGSNKPQ